MKIKNYIQIAIPALIGITCLSSCLKDSRYVDFGASKNVIELPTVQHLGELQVASFPIVATPSPLAVLVNLASPKPSSSPITVTLP